MANINLYFGNPCNEWAQETVTEIALNNDISMREAAFILFHKLVETIAIKPEGQNSLDTHFSWFFDKSVIVPKITARSYIKKGSTYPMIVMSKEYVVDKKTDSQIPVTDSAILDFAKRFEEELGFDFLEFRRTGKVLAKAGEIIYILRNKRHTYRSGCFVEIM